MIRLGTAKKKSKGEKNMKLSKNFVKDYIDIDVDIKTLAEDMTRVGNEYDEAGKLIENKFKQGNVLHFAGANTMGEILKYVPVERYKKRNRKKKHPVLSD